MGGGNGVGEAAADGEAGVGEAVDVGATLAAAIGDGLLPLEQAASRRMARARTAGPAPLAGGILIGWYLHCSEAKRGTAS